MRSLAALCAACLLAGCGPDRATRSQPQAASPAPANTAPAVKFLLAASAKDFHDHQSQYPARFRDVRVGRCVAPDGTKLYLLRGQFLPKQGPGEPAWTPFVTIKTSPYEQWLGAAAEGYCRQSSIVWDDREDLSSALQSQLDSLR